MSALMQTKGYSIEDTENKARYYQQVSVIRQSLNTVCNDYGERVMKRNEPPVDRMFSPRGYAPFKDYQSEQETIPAMRDTAIVSRRLHVHDERPGQVHEDKVQRKRVHGPYTCEDCGKVLKRSSSLSNHRLIHKNVKAFHCEKCGARFLRKSDLGKHYAIHTGSKPYVCNICEKSFSQSSNMLTHKRRHTGVKPFQCDYCTKSFYRKVDVKRHEIVHNISEGE